MEIVRAIATATPILAAAVAEAPLLVAVCVGGALVLASVWLTAQVLRGAPS